MPNKRKAGETLRPYLHADEMQEKLQTSVKLTVSSAVREDTIQSDTDYLLDASEFRGVGLTLHIDTQAIKESCTKLVHDLDEASIVVLAEDGVASAIRATEIIWEGTVDSLPSEVHLFKKGESSDRGVVFGHSSGSKHLNILAIRNKSIDTLSPLKPRLKGAILGKITFNIRPNPSFDSVVPQKLDQEVRERLELEDDCWFAFEPLSGFLIADKFESAFSIYVDETILELGSGDSPLFKTSLDLMLTNLFMMSLIEESIFRLQTAQEDDEVIPRFSAVMTWLKGLLGEDFEEILLGDKTAAISAALSKQKMKERIIKFERDCDGN